jgi:hypothetical protein
MSQKLKTTTTIKKGTIRPKTPHKTRGDNMDDDISAVTEDYDLAAVAFQRKMKQVRKQGNDLISQHEEDNESIAESIRHASSKIDEARNLQAVMLDLKSQLETLQIDYEVKIKGAHMDMLRASSAKTTPMDSKVNVKRGSDIIDYEDDILYGQNYDIAKEDDNATTKFGAVEQFTGSDIQFVPMATTQHSAYTR